MYIERFYHQFVEPFPSWLWEQATHNRSYRAAQSIQNHGKQWTKQYMESPWNPQKYAQYLELKQNPVTGYFINQYETMKDASDYLYNHGIDWSSVTRPWKLPNSGSPSFSGVVNFVSHNIEELYK